MPCITECVDSRELWMLSYLREGRAVIHVVVVDFHTSWSVKSAREMPASFCALSNELESIRLNLRAQASESGGMDDLVCNSGTRQSQNRDVRKHVPPN